MEEIPTILDGIFDFQYLQSIRLKEEEEWDILMEFIQEEEKQMNIERWFQGLTPISFTDPDPLNSLPLSTKIAGSFLKGYLACIHSKDSFNIT